MQAGDDEIVGERMYDWDNPSKVKVLMLILYLSKKL